MARWAKVGRMALWPMAIVALVGGLALVGCKNEAPPTGPTKPETGPGSTMPVNPAPGGADTSPPPDDEQHQPFTKAVRGPEDPPGEISAPPDMTVSGKSTAKIYADVRRLWDSVRFVNSKGERIDYTATVETDHGTMTLALRPDLAPNHVRNFILLSRLSYYEGLFFERVRHEETEGQQGSTLVSIEAGCPLGTGEPATGHLGYWLKPEVPKPDAKVVHEAGTVGACHLNAPDTASCRFYITLAPAPFFDGNFTIFGKVTQGIEVAQAIFKQPSILDDGENSDGQRLQKPVKIHKVVIHQSTAGGSTQAAARLQ